ncbi:hypothetical protein STRDD11_02747 [Streptococcus sp. DD11]|nr:hypothetical protein STRDD11_02747 [Streptococcus sp. DD11]
MTILLLTYLSREAQKAESAALSIETRTSFASARSTSPPSLEKKDGKPE